MIISKPYVGAIDFCTTGIHFLIRIKTNSSNWLQKTN
jgi:hypothetical protein